MAVCVLAYVTGNRFLYPNTNMGHQIEMSKLVHMTEDNAVWTMCVEVQPWPVRCRLLRFTFHDFN